MPSEAPSRATVAPGRPALQLSGDDQQIVREHGRPHEDLTCSLVAVAVFAFLTLEPVALPRPTVPIDVAS